MVDGLVGSEPLRSMYWQCEAWRGDKEIITYPGDEQGKIGKETI